MWQMLSGYGGYGTIPIIAAVLAAVGMTLAIVYCVKRDGKRNTVHREGPPAPKVHKGPVALNPIEKIPFSLVKKKSVSHDTRKFTFALQSKNHVLGLPVGKFLY